MSDETQNNPETPVAEPPAITFAEFLESVPPSQFRRVSDICKPRRAPNGSVAGYDITTPAVSMHCPSDICNGPRVFRSSDIDQFVKKSRNAFLTYTCSNCRKTNKTFALYVSMADTTDSKDGSCYKFGEYPMYGPPTPTRLLRLFGKDRDIFLKGRQCENHGLGIGAFSYYRRLVENHKDQILDEIIKVANKVAPNTVKPLELAKKENQFSKAIESVKDAIPQALRINGHNPLTL